MVICSDNNEKIFSEINPDTYELSLTSVGEIIDGAIQIAQRSFASEARRRYSRLFWYCFNAPQPHTNTIASKSSHFAFLSAMVAVVSCPKTQTQSHVFSFPLSNCTAL